LRNFFLARSVPNASTLEAISIYRGFQYLLAEDEDRARINLRYSDYLINADLLSEAAEILDKHLRKTNLDETVKAALGTKLAAPYLLDQKPQKALETLVSTATGYLTPKETEERTLLKARALSNLKKTAEAIEALGTL